jgi:hypothetical protein
VTGPVTAGIHRVTWDLREPAASLPRPLPPGRDQDLFFELSSGPLVKPGTYRVTWARRVRGKVTPLPGDEEFTVQAADKPDQNNAVLTERFAFQQQVTRLERAVEGALEAANHLNSRLEDIKRALDQTPAIDAKWKTVARDLERRNREVLRALRGDEVLQSRNENVPVSIVERVGYAVEAARLSLARPTTTQRQQYQIASDEFAQVLSRLRRLMDVDLKRLDQALNKAGAPWTPGRLPEWKPEQKKLAE